MSMMIFIATQHLQFTVFISINMTTKKFFLIFPYFLLWIFYFLLTMEERNKYQAALNKGMDCVDSKLSGFSVLTADTVYSFNPNAKPQRRYLTWKEFWQARGYFCNNNSFCTYNENNNNNFS